MYVGLPPFFLQSGFLQAVTPGPRKSQPRPQSKPSRDVGPASLSKHGLMTTPAPGPLKLWLSTPDLHFGVLSTCPRITPLGQGLTSFVPT